MRRPPMAPPGGASPPLLTFVDVAEQLQVSPRTVRRLVDAGKLAVTRIGRAVRVAETDLAAYLRRARVR